MASQPDGNSSGSWGDVLGGLAASTVLLPQAMAFGTAVFVVAGRPASAGALAGLVAAICLGLVAGSVGGAHGLVSGPNGPTFALLSGALLAITASGAPSSALLGAMAAIVVAAGILEIVLGLLRGGELIKFIPYPVIAGFMTGSAVLMIKSQVAALSGSGAEGAWDAWRWMPALVATITFLATTLVPRWLAVPGPLAGLVVGVAAFHALAAFGPGAPPAAWVVGALPHLSALHLGIDPRALHDVPWRMLLGPAAALAVLASLNTLLAAVVTDSVTGARHEARRQIVGQGLGQLASGLFGGIAGSGTTGASVIAARTGGRRLVAVACAGAILLIVLVARGATAWLPVSVLAGIIVQVALVGTVERDILAWARRSGNRWDAATALLVTVVTVTADLVSAVGLGVAIAIVRFVQAQVRAPVVHRRSTAAQRPSLRRRPRAQREALTAHGDRIVLCELQGNLFFGTADRLFRELAADLERPAWIVLDMERVTQVDLTAVRMFLQMRRRATQHGGEILFANVHGGLGLGHDVETALQSVSLQLGGPAVQTFVDADEAIEHAEDELLSALSSSTGDMDRVELADIELTRALDPASLEALRAVLAVRPASTGETLFRCGDAGQELFIVLRGTVDIRLPTTAHHYKRLASFGAGTFFGEVAFLEHGPRTADAVVSSDAELLVLDPAAFWRLEQARPRAAVALLEALSREMASRLRTADTELRRLAGW